MNRKTVRLHACCCIGPHLIAALLSLYYDLRSWYDTIAALAVLLPVFVQFLTNDFSFRAIFHIICILFGIISQEVSRQPRSIDWNQLAQPDNLGLCLCVVHMTKGIATFIKLLPTATVISQPKKHIAIWTDYLGWIISILSSFYFLQEPNIYRNDKAMKEWRLTFAKVETIHWTGLALSASTNFKPLTGGLLVFYTLLQSLVAHKLFEMFTT